MDGIIPEVSKGREHEKSHHERFRQKSSPGIGEQVQERGIALKVANGGAPLALISAPHAHAGGIGKSYQRASGQQDW